MFYDKTNACNIAKQLDEQNMTVHRLKNHLNETGSFKDRQHSGWPRKMLTPKTDILWRHHDVIVIKTPEKWFAVYLMHLEPEFVLKRRGIVLSEHVSIQRRLYTDIFIFKRHRETHSRFEIMDKKPCSF